MSDDKPKAKSRIKRTWWRLLAWLEAVREMESRYVFLLKEGSAQHKRLRELHLAVCALKAGVERERKSQRKSRQEISGARAKELIAVRQDVTSLQESLEARERVEQELRAIIAKVPSATVRRTKALDDEISQLRAEVVRLAEVRRRHEGEMQEVMHLREIMSRHAAQIRALQEALKSCAHAQELAAK